MQRIALASRPIGAPKDSDFRLETVDTPNPQAGEVLVELHYMSLDPYMRGEWMTPNPMPLQWPLATQWKAQELGA